MGATPVEGNLVSEYLNLFVYAPGNLLYFVGLIFFTYAALLMVIEQSLRGPEERASRRYRLALLGIMFALIAMLITAGVAQFNRLDATAILPPLELAVYTLIVLLTGWAFVSAESTARRPWNVALGVLLLALIAGYGYSAVEWYRQAPLSLIDFNATPLALAWTFIPGLLALIFALVLLLRVRAIPNAPLKLVYFLVVLAGYVYTVAQIVNESLTGFYMGSLRATFLLAMPILAIVVYRLIVSRLAAASEMVAGPQQTAALKVRPARPRPVDAPAATAPAEREATLLLRALGGMLSSTQPADLPRQVIAATAEALKADVIALATLKNSAWLDIVSVYDNIRQKPLQGMSINLDEQPTLASAIEHRTQRVMHPVRNREEMADLYTRLDVPQANPLGACYFQPLQENGQVFAVLIVAFPYTSRELRESEIHLLEGLGPIASKLLSLSQNAGQKTSEDTGELVLAQVSGDAAELEAASLARQQMQQSLEMVRDQTNNLSNIVRDLKIELETERGRVAEVLANDEDTLSISQQIMALSQEGHEIQQERDNLASELHEARTTLVGATAGTDNELYRNIIDMLSREQKELEAQKAHLEQQIATLREQTSDMFLVPASIQHTLKSIAEEKNRLAAERDAISSELSDVKSELELLGIDGGVAGLALILGQLYEERDQLRAQVTKLSATRAAAQASEQTEAQVQGLQEELSRVAADREAAVKQRDTLRAERAEWQEERARWQDQRQRLGQQINSIQKQIKELAAQRDRALKERNTVAERHTRLQEERDRLAAERATLQTERDQLLARLEGDRELLEQFGADGIGTLKGMIDDLTAERSNLERQLLKAQGDLELLEGRLQALDRTMERHPELRDRPSLPEDPAVILSVAQELRTPMSSIIGYTDLLLGESVGILGALQRKFLQRVKANIERLGSLVEDLVSIIALDTGQINLSSEPVNILELLDEAIMNAGTQFREKGITLNLDLDPDTPPIQVDRDAMQQVIGQLLSNAYLASPTDGEVSITAQRQWMAFPTPDGQTEETETLYVAVQDQGGGIPPEDQQRVFTRLYRADNPLIQGVGDTGVGLSIARALVEAHHGRIWVESELGVGSRFQFAIPYLRTERV